jgi:hypothetical protein
MKLYLTLFATALLAGCHSEPNGTSPSEQPGAILAPQQTAPDSSSAAPTNAQQGGVSPLSAMAIKPANGPAAPAPSSIQVQAAFTELLGDSISHQPSSPQLDAYRQQQQQRIATAMVERCVQNGTGWACMINMQGHQAPLTFLPDPGRQSGWTVIVSK